MSETPNTLGQTNASKQTTRCCEMVNPGGTWGAFHMVQCKRNCTVYRNGKPYCRQHDPVERKRKLEAALKKSSEKWAARSDREQAMRDAVALLRESQTYIGGDWRKRRDEVLRRLDAPSPESTLSTRTSAGGKGEKV